MDAVSGAAEATYTVEIPAQDAANTCSSFLLYVVDQDAPVTIKDVRVAANADTGDTGDGGDTGPALDVAGDWRLVTEARAVVGPAICKLWAAGR